MMNFLIKEILKMKIFSSHLSFFLNDMDISSEEVMSWALIR